MKRNKKYTFGTKLFIIAITVFTIAGCSKDFLEDPQATDGIPSNVVFSNRTVAEAFITGIMRRFRRQYANVDTGGLYSLYFARTIKGNDLIQRPTFYGFDYGHENRESTYRRTVFSWDYNYEMVNHANVLIDGVMKSEMSDTDKEELIAVGKALRAFHYFQLALEFTPNYTTDSNASRLPIYIEPASGERANGSPTSTTSEVYELILKDLNEAIADLPSSRLGKSYINKEVANGILARVLLVTQNDWLAAANAAKAAYGNDPKDAVISNSWGSGFADLSDQDWLWGMYQDPNETNFFWAAPHVMTDHLVLSYQATYVNTNFVAEFSSTDVRGLFSDIYNSSIPYREFITTKFAFSTDSDLPIMRKSEMVLIDAEAQLNLGNTPEAQDLLYALQVARDPNAVKSTSIGNVLLEEILLERRKELYGEIGVEWFDAKRLRRPINRDPIHRIVINVAVDDELFYLKIPQKEIDANEFIDDSINN